MAPPAQTSRRVWISWTSWIKRHSSTAAVLAVQDEEMGPLGQDLPQMVLAKNADGLEVVDIAVFAAGGGGNRTYNKRPAIQGAVPFLDNLMIAFAEPSIWAVWIHLHEFIDEFIHMNWFFMIMSSYYKFIIWIYNKWWIHMRHFMTFEFIFELMYMKNIVKSYLKSCMTRFQMLKCSTSFLTAYWLLSFFRYWHVLKDAFDAYLSNWTSAGRASPMCCNVWCYFPFLVDWCWMGT